jgi:hypothetical protein
VNPFVPEYVQDKNRAEVHFFRPATQKANPAFPHHRKLPPKEEVDIQKPLPDTAFIQTDATDQELADLHVIHGYSYAQILWLMKLTPVAKHDNVWGRAVNDYPWGRKHIEHPWLQPLRFYANMLDSSRGHFVGVRLQNEADRGRRLQFPDYFPRPEVLIGQSVFGLFGHMPIPQELEVKVAKGFSFPKMKELVISEVRYRGEKKQLTCEREEDILDDDPYDGDIDDYESGPYVPKNKIKTD